MVKLIELPCLPTFPILEEETEFQYDLTTNLNLDALTENHQITYKTNNQKPKIHMLVG